MHRLALTLLIACSSSAPRAPTEWPTCPETPDDQALATDPTPLNLDYDPTTVEAAIKACGRGDQCTWTLYAKRDRCWVPLGQLSPIFDEPRCVAGADPGAFCDLLGTSRLRHGEEQEVLFTFDPDRYRMLRYGAVRRPCHRCPPGP